jgi:hypothetical protein
MVMDFGILRSLKTSSLVRMAHQVPPPAAGREDELVARNHAAADHERAVGDGVASPR